MSEQKLEGHVEYKTIFIRIDYFSGEPDDGNLNTHGKDGWIFVRIIEKQVKGYTTGTGRALFYRQVSTAREAELQAEVERLRKSLKFLLEAEHIKDKFGEGPASEQLKTRGLEMAKQELNQEKANE